MAPTKTVVVLGAGVAGLSLAHFLVSRILPEQPDLRVVLVSPLTHFYFNLASVRFVLPGRGPPMAEDRYLFPIAERFAGYPHADRFRFIAGAATSLHPESNSVTVKPNDEAKEEEIAYHTLVIATGTSYAGGMPWKALGSTDQTRAAVAQLQSQIGSASSIVVGGAGATGVEFSGELGAAYAKKGLKKITLLSADPLPLEPRLKDSVRQTAKKELEKLGVEFVGGARMVSVTPAAGGSGSSSDKDKKDIAIEVTSADGKTKTTKTVTADLFVPTYGVVYNTSFAPPSMHSPASPGRLLQDPDLRARGHRNVFVLGDAGSLEPAQAVTAEAQARHLMKQFRTYLAGGTIETYYTPAKDKVMFGLTVGPDRGTGQVGTFQPPSLLIWWLKGRYLGTNHAANYAAGIGSSNGAWPK
ncbi:FAD/NAD(P)-binding domain-containing protein [Hypoxylon rubiginosum]|uniref:FAD/NAD(P)-binding domain-containing protein n=1 Tax=Hypoxylon rubiginosum TaxID=110542 RepID=A0ACB9YRY1_9PEZI|nr:FAD/NAD(P)-binding domain-containing protein [Hypoxylon rubiginosum]